MTYNFKIKNSSPEDDVFITMEKVENKTGQLPMNLLKPLEVRTYEMLDSESIMKLSVLIEKEKKINKVWEGLIPTNIDGELIISPEDNKVFYDKMIFPNIISKSYKQNTKELNDDIINPETLDTTNSYWIPIIIFVIIILFIFTYLYRYRK